MPAAALGSDQSSLAPPWLRGGTLALAALAHALVIVGVPRSPPDAPARPLPIEIEIVQDEAAPPAAAAPEAVASVETPPATAEANPAETGTVEEMPEAAPPHAPVPSAPDVPTVSAEPETSQEVATAEPDNLPPPPDVLALSQDAEQPIAPPRPPVTEPERPPEASPKAKLPEKKRTEKLKPTDKPKKAERPEKPKKPEPIRRVAETSPTEQKRERQERQQERQQERRRLEREAARRAEAAEARRQARDEAAQRAAAAAARARAAASAAQASQTTGALSASYGSLVAAELNRRKRYPESARAAGMEGVVVVSFTVGPAGRVLGHTITRSSGHAALDSAVVQMMGSVSLPPPPGGSFRVSAPIRFKMN